MIFQYYFVDDTDNGVCVRVLVNDYVLTRTLCSCRTREWADYMANRLNDISQREMKEAQAVAILEGLCW